MTKIVIKFKDDYHGNNIAEINTDFTFEESVNYLNKYGWKESSTAVYEKDNLWVILDETEDNNINSFIYLKEIKDVVGDNIYLSSSVASLNFPFILCLNNGEAESEILSMGIILRISKNNKNQDHYTIYYNSKIVAV